MYDDSTSLITVFNDLNTDSETLTKKNILISNIEEKDKDTRRSTYETKCIEVVDLKNIPKKLFTFDNKINVLIEILNKSYSNKILFLENFGLLISTNSNITKFSCAICNSQKDNGGIYEASDHPTNILNENNKIICTCPCLLKKTPHYSGKSIIGCDCCKNKLKPQHTKIYCPNNPNKKKLVVYWKILISNNLIDVTLNNYLNKREFE